MGYIVIVGVVIFVAYFIISRQKSGRKFVNREELVRQEFVKRNKPNFTVYKKLVVGGQTLGYISRMKEGVKLNETAMINEITLLPYLIKYLGIPNIFAKGIPYFIDDNRNIKDFWTKTVILPAKTKFTCLEGIYYDQDLELEMIPHIKNDNLLRDDYNLLASDYWQKSLEQAGFIRDFGHALAMEQTRQETELAKRKGKVSSI